MRIVSFLAIILMANVSFAACGNGFLGIRGRREARVERRASACKGTSCSVQAPVSEKQVASQPLPPPG